MQAEEATTVWLEVEVGVPPLRPAVVLVVKTKGVPSGDTVLKVYTAWART